MNYLDVGLALRLKWTREEQLSLSMDLIEKRFHPMKRW